MRINSSILDGNIPYLFFSAQHTNVECVSHIHVTMEIVLVTEGTLHMTIRDKDYEIPAGFGTFIAPLEPHKFHSSQPNRCHVIMFSNALVNYFCEFMKTKSPTSHRFPISDASLALVDKILPHETNVVDCIGAEAVLAPICYDIFMGCEFETRKRLVDRTSYRILEYVNEHFRDELTLETVADALHLHPVTVSKIFTKQLGIGFCCYLHYLRCTHAAMLIKMQNLSLSEIAYESGFGSIRSFNRAFLSIYSITPTEYKYQLAKI